MNTSLKQKYFDIFFWITVMFVCLVLLGLPKTRVKEREVLDTREETRRKEEGKQKIHETLAPVVPLVPQREKKQEFRELGMRAVGPLTEKEEHQLKLSNYSAYIRYKAQLEDPSRLTPATQEEIITERIAPKLLDQLKKNRQGNQVQ